MLGTVYFNRGAWLSEQRREFEGYIMRRNATVLALLCGLLFGTIGSIYVLCERALSVTTWTTRIDERISPGAKWQAVVEESTYEANLITDIVASVRLVSIQEPERAADILGVDTGGHAEQRPRIAWIAPGVLRVIVPNISVLKVLRRRFDGVAIDLRFEPDDPSARAAWLREAGLPPDTDPGR